LKARGNKPELDTYGGQRTALCAAAVHAVSALWGDTGCTSGVVGDAAGGVVGLLAVSVAPPLAAAAAALLAAAAAVALATMAANDVFGVARRVGRRAAAVDGTTGSWNTLATRI